MLGYVVSTQNIDGNGILDDTLMTFKSFGKEGKAGIELTQDELLKGENGGEIWSVDPAGFKRQLIEQQNPIPGKDLKLSLDLDIQLVAEEALQGKRGSAVMLEIATGEVLAMVSLPGYDPNRLMPRIRSKYLRRSMRRVAGSIAHCRGSFRRALHLKSSSPQHF